MPDSISLAVIGPTGTVGVGLMPHLEADPRVGRLVGVSRSAPEAGERGWEHRPADVRDEAALSAALEGAEVVVHLAFDTTGKFPRRTLHEINVEGTLNAVRAAKAAGARRFVFASSVAAYGFHSDNPVPLTEEWPTRPDESFFYARQKAELEDRLQAEAADLELYLVRPAVVLGEHPAGAKVPGPLAALVNGALRSVGRSPVPLPVPAPDFPFQVVHEADAGQAFARCAVGDGAPGAYNVAADGVLTGPDVARLLGLTPVRVPRRLTEAAARAAAALPLVPAGLEWIEAAAHPAIMDTAKAKRELGWAPSHSALDTLRATLGVGR